jgi:hypothetical protein
MNTLLNKSISEKRSRVGFNPNRVHSRQLFEGYLSAVSILGIQISYALIDSMVSSRIQISGYWKGLAQSHL